MKCSLLAVLCLACTVAVISGSSEDRVKEQKLSDAEHFEGEEHNVEYDHEAFLGDEAEAFNQLSPEESKARLSEIVTKIDADGDGSVTAEEMADWIKKSQQRYVEQEVQRQWEAHAPESSQDQEHVSWDDYQQNTYGFVGEQEEGEEQEHYQRMISRDQRRWQTADKDGDGQLSRAEFSTFLHPEEAEHMRDIVVKETIEDIDRDGDGKLTVDEYIGDMYDAESDENAGAEEPEWVQHEREMFKSERDADGNGYLDDAEVKAWIMPSDYDHSVAESQHLIHEADTDRDGALSRDEILEKYDLFVGSQATDFGAALYPHEEL